MVDEPQQQDVLGAGAGGPLTPPSPWTQYPGYVNYQYGVTIGTPSGGSRGNGTLNVQAAIYINGQQVYPGNVANYLPLAGGTLTGMLTLALDPVNPFDAVDKRYVDSAVTTINNTFGNYLPLAGGTMTGNLTMGGSTILMLNHDPTVANEAATKHYVDVQSSTIAIPDAPSDGNTYWRLNATWVSTIDMGTF